MFTIPVVYVRRILILLVRNTTVPEVRGHVIFILSFRNFTGN